MNGYNVYGMNMSLLTKQLLTFILAITVIGCGYTFKGGESILPPDVKRVYIPIVKNGTTEPGIDIVLTEALRDEFERYGVLTVSEERAGADAVLNAKILRIKQESRTSTSNTDQVLQQATVMIVSAELKRRTGPLLWKNPVMKVSKVFSADQDTVVTSSADFAGGNIDSSALADLNNLEVSRGQQRQALEDLSETVATRIYSQAVLPEF